jgi:hypothetical protein
VVDALDDADGSVTLDLPMWPGFSRSDTTTDLHGGVTAALIDIAGHDAVARRADHRAAGGRSPQGPRRVGGRHGTRPAARRTIGTVAVHDAAGVLIVVGRGKYSTV